MAADDFGASGSKNRSGGPGNVSGPRLTCSTSISNPWLRVCSTGRPRQSCVPVRRARRAGQPGQQRRRRFVGEAVFERFADQLGMVKSLGVRAQSLPVRVQSNSPQSRCHIPSLPHAICTAPSRQRNSPYGEIEDGGCRAPAQPARRLSKRFPGIRVLRRPRPAKMLEQPGPGRCAGGHRVRRARRKRRKFLSEVRDRHADTLHVIGRWAGHRHQPRLPLGDLVVTRRPPPAHRDRIRSPTAQSDAGLTRISCRRKSQGGPALRSGSFRRAHRHDERVGERRLPGHRLQVDRDGLLVSVGGHKVCRLPLRIFWVKNGGPQPRASSPPAGCSTLMIRAPDRRASSRRGDRRAPATSRARATHPALRYRLTSGRRKLPQLR